MNEWTNELAVDVIFVCLKQDSLVNESLKLNVTNLCKKRVEWKLILFVKNQIILCWPSAIPVQKYEQIRFFFLKLYNITS